MIRSGVLLSTVLLAAITMNPLPAAAQASCESLTSLSLPQTTITTAQVVAAGQFTPPTGAADAFRNVPAFCRVAATVKPTSDSDIKFEVWMPAAGWNRDFAGIVNDGGVIGLPAMAAEVRRGAAVVSTDAGHVGGGMSFATGHPEKVIDFAYRGLHESTVKSKAIVARFYGSGPQLSYIIGSGGGTRMALSTIQRYPEDYDVVSASSIGTHKSMHHVAQVWQWMAMHKTPQSAVPPAKLPAIRAAAIEACDMLVDKAKDGIIEDPTRCKFDPATIQCKGADSPTCLTAPQVEAVRMIYSPVIHEKTGKDIFSPLYPSSELGWEGLSGPNEPGAAVEYFKYIVFDDPSWDPKKRPLNFGSDADLAFSPAKSIVNASNPDYSAFFRRGGKMIIAEGWNNTSIPPRIAAEYYKEIVAKSGNDARNGIRLYMVPGMQGAPGRTGADNFDVDLLKILRDWKAGGKAPDQIVADRYKDGTKSGNRLLCPYPQVSVYKGSGPVDNAANFSCTTP